MQSYSIEFLTSTTHLIDHNDSIMAMENWEHVLECKKKFLERNENPLDCPFIRRDVAKSWLRSRDFGVDPYSPELGNNLDKSQLQAVLKENNLLIETAKPLIKAFKNLAIDSGYVITLQDRRCVFLLQEGNLNEINSFKNINQVIGACWSEKTIGTCAHTLCMQLKKPIQLLGPENYSMALQNNLSSAAPIFDECQNLIGTLILVHDLGEFPRKQDLNKIQTHSLGWISSMALAIEQQMRLKRNNKNLTVVNNTLEATLSFIDEGIIMVDLAGKIIRSNPEGLTMLKINAEDAKNYNILDHMNVASPIVQAIKGGLQLNYAEELLAITPKKQQAYIISTRPVCLQENTEIVGAVIRLSYVDKINALVARRNGNNAVFSFESIIGDSKEINHTKQMCQRFANSPENILLIGESGTGKELFAQAVHNASRSNGPFIAINCAAMPRNLIESELFGYEGGSFTGSSSGGRPGKIELANGGTLFLDEIGDMPFEIQAVLLRVLEDKKVMRIGGKRYQTVDFRLVAATNKDLYKMVKEKTFRDDLYFRLCVLKLYVPPLRKRGDDILLLARYFIQTYCEHNNLPLPKISDAAATIISRYNWPGNVRELENSMIYAVNMTQEEFVYPEHLPEEIMHSRFSILGQGTLPLAGAGDEEIVPLQDVEILLIRKALSRTNNNVAQTADLLKVGKSTLYRKIKEYGIDT